MARRVILEEITGGVCELVFIAVRKATPGLIYRFLVWYWIIHPYLGSYRKVVRGPSGF